eukprot:488743-Amphidinium_carterae.1
MHGSSQINTCLSVCNVYTLCSAADQWNVANPSMQVTAGALIMKINGKSAEDMGPKACHAGEHALQPCEESDVAVQELLNAFKITPSISM